MIIGSEQGTTFPTKVGPTLCNALIDTGATKSCMSESYYKTLHLDSMRSVVNTRVKSATGSNLSPLGIVNCPLKLGNTTFVNDFIVCQNLTRPLILGKDFLMKNQITVRYAENGKCVLQFQQEEMVAAIDVSNAPQLTTSTSVLLPGRTLAVIQVKSDLKPEQVGQIYEVQPNEELSDKHPNLYVVPMIHNVDTYIPDTVPMVLINLSIDTISLSKGEIMGFLQNQSIDISEISTETATEPSPIGIGEDNVQVEKKFITSPADIEVHRKINLQDADVSEEHQQAFQNLCYEFNDIFSVDSGDIGKTPLVEVEIDTGDSPPITQKPYTLPLKHAEWVQKELEILEKAGVIVRSVSPWASPIVVVPKRSAPGEPPKRRLCVDYRAINSLLPPVKKAYSKAKGITTLVPLPKIDEIYARLKDSKIYSTFDMRSGYYHMVLSEESRPKSAFVSAYGKWEFKRCPFGLAQAPAYFQRLINEVLSGLTFAFGYLDDILVYSPDMETHLKHLRILFERLRSADLKLKEVKCNFLKKHIQYLGHIISGEGITPVPEKLESIQNMLPPTTPKEVKQFLGLIGYYRKFVPRFSDLARPLNALTRKETVFEWTQICQESFELLKTSLMTEPILTYPDPNLPYVLFTDASKYAWACVLTQEKTHVVNDKEVQILHPITYMSGLFKGSQMNWACLTKEAYAIYMSIKKLAYYLEDADITLRSDHLPLKKFLAKNTLNSKVNNWAIEISPFRITFEYIKGIKNTLADTMSRLIEIDPQVQSETEPEGYEFGYYTFDQLPAIDVNNVQISSQNDQNEDISCELPIQTDILIQLQQDDAFCQHIRQQIEKGNIKEGHLYKIDNQQLKRLVTDGDNTYETIVIPRSLIPQVLHMAHDKLGHNGTHRTYVLLKRLYYWKGLKPSVERHIKRCPQCQSRNKQVVKYAKLHFDVATFPMQFISMDLIGEFHPPTSKRHRYALTVICMLTGYVFCVPLKTKTAEEVIQAYIDNVYAKFGGSLKILSDNGTEFKNKLFEQIAKELGVEHKLYTPPYHPASNGRIEGFHAFLKACIAKHVAPQLEWDALVPLACAAYNFIPNEHSKESPFFLMFGRDPVLPLNKLLEPKVRYMGNDMNVLSLEALKNMYEIAATNLKMAREKKDSPKDHQSNQLQPGDMVLVQNHSKGPFDPKYIGNYRVVSIKGNQIEIRPSIGGPTEIKHIKHVKYIHPVDQYVKHVPDYSTFGRKTTLRINPRNIPDLQWQLNHSLHTTNIGQTTPQISTPCVDVNTLSFAGKRKFYSNGINLHMDSLIISSNTDAISSIKIAK